MASISLNGGHEWIVTNAVVNYQVLARISSIAPRSGPISGGTLLVVKGTNIADRTAESSLICRFSRFQNETKSLFRSGTLAKFSTAQYVSENEVFCRVPPEISGGDVFVEISSNGGIDFTNDGVIFTYEGDAKVTEVFPTDLPVSGGTVISVHGVNFTSTQQCHCRNNWWWIKQLLSTYR